MGSLARLLIKGRREVAAKRRIKKPRPDTEIMVSKKSLYMFRFMMFAFFSMGIVLSGYAPNKAPKLPEGVSD